MDNSRVIGTREQGARRERDETRTGTWRKQSSGGKPRNSNSNVYLGTAVANYDSIQNETKDMSWMYGALGAIRWASL